MIFLLRLSLALCLGLVSAEIPKQCINAMIGADLMTLVRAVDAWGKPEGVLRGSFSSLGDMFACEVIQDKGFQYATVNGKLILHLAEDNQLELPSQLGVCLPRECQSVEILRSILTIAVQPKAHNTEFQAESNPAFLNLISDSMSSSLSGPSEEGKFAVSFSVDQVRPLRSTPWSTGATIMSVIIGIIFLVVIFATFLDWKFISNEFQNAEVDIDQDKDPLLPEHRTKTPKDSRGTLLSSFSLYRTLPLLFDTQQKRHSELAILNVIRTISMCWIMFCHGVGVIITDVQIDVLDFVDWVHYWGFMPVVNAFFSVDSFFYMSTFLVAYLMFQNPKTCQRFNYLKYVVLRFLRTTPTYMFIMFTWFYLLPYMGHGPIWYNRQEEQPEQCAKYWWAGLLYINNFVPEFFMNACMGWSWYLANDFQLYLIVPIFVLPLGIPKWRRFAPYILGAGMVIGAGLTLGLSAAYKVRSIAVPDASRPPTEGQNELEEWQKIFYSKPYPRLSLVVIAVAAAYLMTKMRQKVETTGLKVRSIWLWLMRLVGAGMLVAVLYAPYDVAHRFVRWPLAASTSYNFLSRVFWALGLSFFIYPSVVHAEQESIIHSFCCWGGWKITARLTYCVYLTHCFVLNVLWGSTVRGVPYTQTAGFILFGSTMFWSYLASVVLFVIVEAPTGSIIRRLTGK